MSFGNQAFVFNRDIMKFIFKYNTRLPNGKFEFTFARAFILCTHV